MSNLVCESVAKTSYEFYHWRYVQTQSAKNNFHKIKFGKSFFLIYLSTKSMDII